MGTVALIVIAVIFLIVVIVLVVVGISDAGDSDPLQERLAEFAARGETVSLEEIELSQSLTQRIIMPLARKMGDLAIRFTPQNALQSTARKLELAGNPRGWDPAIFWVLRIVLAVGLSALMFFVLSASSVNWSWSRKLLIIGLMVGAGFYLPELLINSMVQRRQKAIRLAMPDALDLLTICVEAGLGFDGAMNKVHEKWDNELSLSFGRAIREIQLGKLRREALKDMAERVGIPEMTSFIAAVVQSEQLGVSMAKVLRIQSDQMRIKRRQRAEYEAHQAPIKMLIPMSLLIFPSICIILMAPSVIRMLQSDLGRMFGF